MEHFLNCLLGIGEWLFPVLIMNEDSVQTRNHSPLCRVERSAANRSVFSSFLFSLLVSVPRILRQHTTSSQRLRFIRCLLIFHQLHSMALPQWCVRHYFHASSPFARLSLGKSYFLEKFLQMADGTHFVFGRHNHGSLKASRQTAKSSNPCG